MNPGYRRPGRILTGVLGAVLVGIDLVFSALLWLMIVTLLPTPGEWVALPVFAAISCAVLAWPDQSAPRRDRLLAFWYLPVSLLRVLAIRFRGWVARYPVLDLLWRGRFVVGIAAIVQNAQAGSWLLGLIPAGIIAASYLLPWLRRVHARRARAAAHAPVRRVRVRKALGTSPVRSGEVRPLDGALR